MGSKNPRKICSYFWAGVSLVAGVSVKAAVQPMVELAAAGRSISLIDDVVDADVSLVVVESVLGPEEVCDIGPLKSQGFAVFIMVVVTGLGIIPEVLFETGCKTGPAGSPVPGPEASSPAVVCEMGCKIGPVASPMPGPEAPSSAVLAKPDCGPVTSPEAGSDACLSISPVAVVVGGGL